MTELFNMIRDYILYIQTHRDIYKQTQKRVKKKYCLSIRIGMTLEYTFHDLNKIFTPRFFDYVVMYNSIAMCKNLDFTKFNKLSMHDLWLADNRRKPSELYKHIFKLMEDNDGFREEYLELVAETFIKTSEHVGEDPIAVYFRNYRQFKLSDKDRNIFENAIGINFDGYFSDIPDYCVERILRNSIDKDLNSHIVYTLLNENGINILEVLNLEERRIL